MEPTKKWYLSKTVWVSFVTLIGAILWQAEIISAELSASTVALILTVIQFLLRLVTKQPIVWKDN